MINNPKAPGKGQNGAHLNDRIQNTDINFDNILNQVKNAPGKDFKGFDIAAGVISQEYCKLDEHDRQEIYRKVLQARAEGEHEDVSDLEFWLDNENGIRFSKGNLYRLTRTEKRDSERLLSSAPLTIQGVMRTDYDTEIHYIFAGKQYNATIKDMVTHISANMKSTREANKSLTELLHKYAIDQENKGMVKVVHEPIFIEHGIISVAYDTSGIAILKTLETIRNFYPISANPHAFLSAFAYNLIAPLAYHIRVNAPAGYLFPMRISSGRTSAAKTSTDSIFVLTGFAQSKEDGILTNEQVATPFTLQKNMENSTLPVIINDISGAWLDKVSTMIKNSSENAISGDRGNPDQSLTRRYMKRALNMTSNEIITPSDDAAKMRRYILEEYTDEHAKRRNTAAFWDFINALPKGFLFAIFRQILDGKKLLDIVSDVVQTEDSSGLVNYVLDKINVVCAGYGVEPFPKYEVVEKDVPDSFSELAEWLAGQWNRINESDDYGRLKAPYPEISRTEIDVDETDIFVVYWFTGSAYKTAQRRLKLPHQNVTSLFSNYIENNRIEIVAINKPHKFAGQAGRGFAIRVKKDFEGLLC